MQSTKDLLKLIAIFSAITLPLVLIGSLPGNDSKRDGVKDYFNNIDYTEQEQIKSLKDTL